MWVKIYINRFKVGRCDLWVIRWILIASKKSGAYMVNFIDCNISNIKICIKKHENSKNARDKNADISQSLKND